MTTRARYGEKPATLQEIIFDPDLNIGRFMEKTENHNLRLVSKGFNRAFYDDLKCADAQELQEELQAMRNEPEPCKNTAKVIYKPETGLQRAIMCAIMSKNEARSSDLHQDLHVYLFEDHLEPFMHSESVKCFDNNYKLNLTLLFPCNVQQYRPNLHCRGGFHALEYHVAEEGRYPDDAEVVLFTGNAYVAERESTPMYNSDLIALLDMSTLKRIGKYAFFKCSLSEIVDDMPEVTDIFDQAFTLSALTRLGNTPKLKVIHPRAFLGCDELKQLGDVSALTEIKESAFEGCDQLTQLKLPQVETIGNSAFEGCGLLEQLDMPSVKTIGDHAFSMCPLLAQLGEMRNLTEIGREAFAECRIERLNMQSLSKIGAFAFWGCGELEGVGNMPELTGIGREAFARCFKLNTLHLPKALNSVGNRAFEGCPLGKITVEPGADFKCHCNHLADKLNRLEGIQVKQLQATVAATAAGVKVAAGWAEEGMAAGGFRITYPSESTGVVR